MTCGSCGAKELTTYVNADGLGRNDVKMKRGDGGLWQYKTVVRARLAQRGGGNKQGLIWIFVVV